MVDFFVAALQHCSRMLDSRVTFGQIGEFAATTAVLSLQLEIFDVHIHWRITPTNICMA